MKKRIWIIALLLVGVAPLSLAAQPMAGVEAQKKTEQAIHQGTGKVVSVDRKQLGITLAHEAIKSLNWPAMTMEFYVAKASLLDGLKAGELVRFELRQSNENEWVIVKIEHR